MKKFTYLIKDPIGIHARPAGELAKKAKEYKSVITIEKEGKKTDTARLMAVLGMAVKCKDEVIISAEGSDEAEAIIGMKSFFEETL